MKCFLTTLFTTATMVVASAQSRMFEQTIQSKSFNGNRSLSIYLPDGYSAPGDTTGRFPVLYLFDAQFKPYFSMVTSMIEYYEQSGMGAPLIVVGIHTEDRWNEFAPMPTGGQKGQNEGSDQLHDFLVNEVFPFVDSSYHTANFRIGVGHSLGGTFVVNEALREPSTFQAVIAASPNLTIIESALMC